MMLRLLSILALLVAVPQPSPAQDGMFAPRIVVNGRAITQYEYDQRYLMLQLFRVPGDIEQEATTGLIDDRIRMAAGKSLGLSVTAEGLQAGMEEFASRANLSAEAFLKALGEAGVAPETFRDFVEAGLLWREVVRVRFVGRVTISDREIDRAIAATTQSANVRVLLSEIILPAPPGGESAAMALARRLKGEITTEGAFAAAARSRSASPSAGRGGRLDWTPLADLPAVLAPVVLGLAPGEVSDPIQLPNAVALFQLRAIEEGAPVEAQTTQLDYAVAVLTYAADPVAEAQRLTLEADTCNDLNALVPAAVPEAGLRREVQPIGGVPGDIALELARLDPGEGAPMLRSGTPVWVMLCARLPLLETPVDRNAMRENLLNQRLSALADGFLEELRADAIISEPGLALPSEDAGN